MVKWIEPDLVSVPPDLQDLVGGHPLVSQVLARRGFTRPADALAFLEPGHYQPASPNELPGLRAAVQRLEGAIQREEKICVWGDFDVDGQTATTLLVSTFQELGAQVTYHIPIRETESHGIHLPALTDAIQDGARLVLSCDTGIAAHEAITFANTQGVDVIVTDHHDLPASLPDAYAIINPKLLPPLPGGEIHPLGTLPGVGVAYKLAEALYARAGNPKEVDQHLDLVALGIVADLALLNGEARYLLQRGLEALRHPHRTGLQTMMALAELNPEHLTEEHIGYVLAPRLNALGRLSDANAAVELLTTQDSGRARVLASQLEGLNAQRQLLTNQVFQAAQAQIERTPSLLDQAALVLAHPRWPAGVIGIVASQLVEQYNKPVVLISTPDGGPARGSARSIEGVNITAAIASQAEILEGFGGHPMAAGLALPVERVEEFRSGLSKAVEEMLGQTEIEPHLNIDAYLDLSDISLKLVDDLERLAPFGPGNPALTLACGDLILKHYTEVGRNREHRRMFVEDEQGKIQEIIWWNGSNWRLPEGKFDLAYHLRASDYRGQREVQVEWVASRPAGGTSALPSEVIPITVLDYRGKPQPLQLLKSLPETDLQIWCEGEAKDKLAAFGLNVQDRDTLSTGQELAIWTTPPGQRELRAVLQTVSPQKVYLFGFDPVEAELEIFLKRLAGLVKYSLSNQNGQVRISQLAAGTAQGEATIQKGLAWMAAKGYLRVSEEGDRRVVSQPGEADPHDLEQITSQLQTMLKETAAYRAHFARASADHLINPPEGV